MASKDTSTITNGQKTNFGENLMKNNHSRGGCDSYQEAIDRGVIFVRTKRKDRV